MLSLNWLSNCKNKSINHNFKTWYVILAITVPLYIHQFLKQTTCMSALYRAPVDKRKTSSTCFGSASGFRTVKMNSDFPKKMAETK